MTFAWWRGAAELWPSGVFRVGSLDARCDPCGMKLLPSASCTRPACGGLLWPVRSLLGSDVTRTPASCRDLPNLCLPSSWAARNFCLNSTDPSGLTHWKVLLDMAGTICTLLLCAGPPSRPGYQPTVSQSTTLLGPCFSFSYPSPFLQHHEGILLSVFIQESLVR